MDVQSVKNAVVIEGGSEQHSDALPVKEEGTTESPLAVFTKSYESDAITSVPEHRDIPVLPKDKAATTEDAEPSSAEKAEPLRIEFKPVSASERWKELPRDVYERAILAGSFNYDTGAISHASEAEAMSVVRALSRRGPVIVDVGGEGRNPRALNLNIGVLQSKNETEAIPRVVLGSAFNIPLADNSADMIIVESSPVAAAQLARVIKPGGTIRMSHPADYGKTAHAGVHDITGGDMEQNVVEMNGVEILETTIRIAGPRKEDEAKA